MKIGKKDLIWSYAAQILRFGSALIVLPLVLSKLDSEELAIWYLFSSVSGLVLLLDFGFSNTIIRNLTYVFAGAKSLMKEGLSNESHLGTKVVDSVFLAKIITSIRLIYMILACIAFIILATLGTYYLSTIIEANQIKSHNTIWISWVVFIFSTILMIYYLYLNALLMGRGYIKHAQKAQIIYSFSFIVLAYIGLVLGYGLLSLSLSLLIASIIERIILINSFYDDWIKESITKTKVSFEEKKELISIIWFNAKKMGTVAIGGFLINRLGQFFVTSYFTLKVAAQYGLTMQIISFVSSASIIYFNTIYPKMSYDFFKKNFDGVRKSLGISLVIIIVFFTISGFGILLFDDIMLKLINSQTILLNNYQIILILIMFFLEIQHSVTSNVLTFENKIPFVKPAIISGLAILFFTYIFLNFIVRDVWVLILIQFGIQLVYNNWKWPYEAFKILKTNYFSILRNGFKDLLKFRGIK